MKKVKKFTSLLLTLALSLGLTSSLTACSVPEVKDIFTITAIEDNNLDVKLISSETSTVSESGYLTQKLTATVSPKTNYNQAVNWSVAWKNAESTWATGKTVTDYVEVVPESEGSLTATVTCKQAFGEQVNVIVSSQQDSTKRATCVCDYNRRLLDFDLNKIGINEIKVVNGEKRIISKLGYSEVSDTDIDYNAVYSDYTVSDNDSEFTIYMRLTDEFRTALGSYYVNSQVDMGAGSIAFGADINMRPISVTGDLVLNAVTMVSSPIIKTYYNCINAGSNPIITPTAYLNILSSFGSDKPVGHIIIAKVERDLSNSSTYETLFEYPIYLDESVAQMAVETVALSRNTVTF